MRSGIFFCCIFLILSFSAQGQQKAPYNPWRQVETIADEQKNTSARLLEDIRWQLDLGAFRSILGHSPAGLSVQMPLPEGMHDFIIHRSGVMSRELAAKYPTIKTWSGVSMEDPSTTLRFDITPHGFHGMILSGNGITYIDPEDHGREYKSYHKKDHRSTSRNFTCHQQGGDVSLEAFSAHKSSAGGRQARSGTQLKKYRLAVTTTGEYATFHGGTTESTLAAIVTTMNRVVGIYERELAVTLELVQDTDLLIYTNPATDPYSNGDTNLFIDEVQSNIDVVIGDANYDIGHGLSTGAGGLAGLGVVCRTGLKAEGVTGTNNPAGDPFDVDFVAHEIGHQFGATHTFNGNAGFCSGGNRSASTAYEPGSGSTIMAYAGICGVQNIQNNSNDYFHGASLEQIINYTTTGAGSNCPVTTGTNNTPPAVDAGTGGFHIPVHTPFKLEGSATDPEKDALTYCWEQFDLGPAGSPDLPQGNAPLFRSFTPVTEPYRIFPQPSDILAGTQTLGELLPSTSRELNFRLTVRDNRSGGGGVDYDDLSFMTTDTAGPFSVTSQSDPVEENGGNPLTVTWDVANTDVAPVSCQAVNILLSEDGGLSFPHLLASGTANDGEELVILPDIATTEARLKVEAADNVFFNISDTDFTVRPGFFLVTNKNKETVCSPGEAVFDVTVRSILGFSNPVNLGVNQLEDGITTVFSSTTLIPGDTVQLTISDTEQANGSYQVVVTGNGGSLMRETTIDLNVISEPPDDILLNSPAGGESNVSLLPTFSWSLSDAEVTYQVEIADDAAFTQVIASDSGMVSNVVNIGEPLVDNRQYFWRVRANTVCEAGTYAEATFRTISVSDLQVVSTDVPQEILPALKGTYFSTLEVENMGMIYDVNVTGLTGEHTRVQNLRVTLRAPDTTEVVLFSEICAFSEDFNIQFDDQSRNDHVLIPCPATDGEAYKPLQALQAFNGKEAQGTWTLIVEDLANFDGGRLLSWGLEIFIENELSAPLAPSGLRATLVAREQVDLQWEDNADDEENYLVERVEGNGRFQQIATVGADVVSYQDQSITDHGDYYYRVRAQNAGGASLYSNEVEVSILVGIGEEEPEKVSFYPNPTDGWLYLTGMDTSDEFMIIITDLTGRKVGQYTRHSLRASPGIDLSFLPQGIYVVSILYGHSGTTARLVKR